MKVLEIFIDGEWRAYDFAMVLEELEVAGGLARGDSYEKLRARRWASEGDTIISVPSDSGPSTYDRPSTFNVYRISFASPGSIDLLGLAKCVEQVRLLLEFIIDTVVKRNDRELDREERKLRIAAIKADLMEKYPSAGISGNFEKLLSDENADGLITAVMERRITKTTESSPRNYIPK